MAKRKQNTDSGRITTARCGVIEYFDSMHTTPGHKKCGRPHGHTYKIEVTAEGRITRGMVIDFLRLKEIVSKILKKYDHINLNKIIPLPTAENIAICILGEIQKKLPGYKIFIKLWEGEAKFVEVSGDSQA